MFKTVKYGMRKIKGAGLASVCFLGFAFFAMSTVKGVDYNGDLVGTSGDDKLTIPFSASGYTFDKIIGDGYGYAGNDTVDIVSGGSITGSIFGGDGDDTINFSGGTLGGNISSVETINYTGTGSLELKGTITDVTKLEVKSGELILNNSNSNSNFTSADVVVSGGKLDNDHFLTFKSLTVKDGGYFEDLSGGLQVVGAINFSHSGAFDGYDTTEIGSLNIAKAGSIYQNGGKVKYGSINEITSAAGMKIESGYAMFFGWHDYDLGTGGLVLGNEAGTSQAQLSLACGAGGDDDSFISNVEITGNATFNKSSILETGKYLDKKGTDSTDDDEIVTGKLKVIGTVNFKSGVTININRYNEDEAPLQDGDKLVVIDSTETLQLDGSDITDKDDLDDAVTVEDGFLSDFELEAIDGDATLSDLQVTVIKAEEYSEDEDYSALSDSFLTYLDNLDDNNPLWVVLDSIDSMEVALQIEQQQWTETPASANTENVIGIVSSFNNTVMEGGQSQNGTLLGSLNSTPSGAAGPNVNSSKLTAWAKAFGSSGEQDTDKKFTGYESDAYGLALGLEKNIDEKLSVGLSLGTSMIEVTGDKNVNSDIDSYHFGLYGKYKTSDLFIEGALSYTISNIDMDTTSIVAGLNSTADTDANTYGLYVGAGKTIAMNKTLSITPKLGVTYSHYEQDSYTEKGGFGRSFKSYGQDSFVSNLGTKVTVKADKFTPEFNIAWLHEFEDSKGNVDYTTTGGIQNYKTDVRAAESDRFKVGIGTGINLANNLDLNVNYDHEFSSDYSSDSLSAMLSYKF